MQNLAFATQPTVEIKPAEVGKLSKAGTVSFAQMPVTVPDIVLSLECANVTVQRINNVDKIEIGSNCPAHWNVTSSQICQAAVSTAQKGVSLKADASGGQITLNGQIYQLPRDADGAIRNLKVDNGVVSVNGKKLAPIPGSSMPGDCTGPDLLEVNVPTSYSGSLVLLARGGSNIVVDGWSRGSVSVTMNGTSSLEARDLTGVDKLALDVQGDGVAKIKGVTAKAFVANITGAGKIMVDAGSATMSNATVSGNGSINLHGKFKNLRRSVTGSGSIEVKE